MSVERKCGKKRVNNELALKHKLASGLIQLLWRDKVVIKFIWVNE